MAYASLPLSSSPIEFGTDGWRGVLGVDITIERLLAVAAASAQELAYRAPSGLKSRKILIGFDRRFLAPELAEASAAAIRGSGLEPLLASTPLTTPACSWAVVQRKALGALVITASHNPPEWLGMKIKGPFGGSVESDFTKAVEKRLLAGGKIIPLEGITKRFDGRKEHLEGLRSKFDISGMVEGLNQLGLKLIIDPMHGVAAGCISEVFGEEGSNLIQEIRSQRDTLFGGNSPEPLQTYLSELISRVKAANASGQKTIGLAFDGDGDRIAAVDEKGNFCSTQLLIPLLVDHLGRTKNLPGSVIKTVSGSDVITLVAKSIGRKVVELPVGFKYIAAEMLSDQVLLGGEESGGVGFGGHLPERDALFTALVLIEALVEGGRSLGDYLDSLKRRFGGECVYDRIDLRLASMENRNRLEALLKEEPPLKVASQDVIEVSCLDGVKFRLGQGYWLMMRFSGTEPLLRIYCEAPSHEKLFETLEWAKEFAQAA
ncbi:phosphoglucomutase/phosphomannomutase family protein [Prochlorococcus sp. MIT 1341]|uniref:phosphoglucomutase/phosphomannomutase family protein n=1 Tax=Prochlorococcus sp. MIT 1341 TaxID=3096221 RepID=UPI002A752BE5|nr:phosphoglucomutase/phosphomannomutase family protein [Prochlorococcus sp. MIT 1341]